MKTDKIEKQARVLRTHTVVYADTVDIMVAVRAMQGQTTKSIAAEFGITESKAQYRIQKAQNALTTRFRSDYRSGKSDFAQYVRAATAQRAQQIVKTMIAPKFAPLAANRGGG